MAELIAQSPFAGRLPVTIGTVEIAEVTCDTAFTVAPFKGQERAVSVALKSATGVTFPKAGRTTSAGTVRAIWTAGGQALIVGAKPDVATMASVTDQSDGFAVALVRGADAEAVLARLVPVDLRLPRFAKGHTARTLIGHMTASVTRISADSFEVMVMRSMAGTLVHDLERAAIGVAGRTADQHR